MPRTRNSKSPTAYLSSTEIANYFKVSIPTARRWMDNKSIKNCFISGKSERRAPAVDVKVFAELRLVPISEWLRACVSLYNAQYNETSST